MGVLLATSCSSVLVVEDETRSGREDPPSEESALPSGAGGAGAGGTDAGGSGHGGSPEVCGQSCLGACNGAPEWTTIRDFGPNVFLDMAELRGMAVDADGNAAIAAWVSGPIDLGSGVLDPLGAPGAQGMRDIVIAKISPEGQTLWSRRTGSDWDDGVGDVAMDAAGNILLVGSAWDSSLLGTQWGMGPAFVAKLDPNGDLLWAHGIPSSDLWETESWTVRVAPNGNVILAGALSDPLDLGGGALEPAQSMFLAAFDADGNHLWSRAGLGPVGVERPRIDVGPDSSITMASWFDAPLDLGGGEISQPGQWSSYVARFDSAGGLVWQQTFLSEGRLVITGLDVGPDGQVFLGGSTWGEVDFGTPFADSTKERLFLAALDANGERVWAERFEGASPGGGQFLRSVAVDPAGQLVVLASVTDQIDFGGGPLTPGDDIAYGYLVTAKLDACGGHLWSRLIGQSSYMVDGVVTALPSGDLILGGTFGMFPPFEVPLDFGDSPHVPSGDSALYFARLHP